MKIKQTVDQAMGIKHHIGFTVIKELKSRLKLYLNQGSKCNAIAGSNHKHLNVLRIDVPVVNLITIS